MSLTIQATLRGDQGKGSSRRLRKEGNVPAILYGSGFDPISLSITQREIQMLLNDPDVVSKIHEVSLNGTAHKALLKAVQRHVYKNIILHADFLKVSDETVVNLNIPIHFLNEAKCKGVTQEGGMITHSMTEIAVRAKVKDIPSFIEIDLGEMGVGSIVHISDLELGKGVESIVMMQGQDQPIVSVVRKGAAIEEDEDDAETSEEASE